MHAQGFFGVFGKVFATIRAEDIPHGSNIPEGDYQPFGKVCTRDTISSYKGAELLRSF